MFYDFLITFVGNPPVMSFQTLPECFVYFGSVILCLVSLSVVIRGVYSIIAAGFRNKL